jgi:hypothetical protein
MISRRTILKGAGAALGLPFLEAMLPAAVSTATPPLRLAIVTVTGGTVLESWRPKEAGPLGKLPSILRALEPVKGELLVLSGLAHGGKTEGLNGHEAAGYTHLTGAPAAGKEKGKPFASVSVDQRAAQAIGDRSVLPSLEIGTSNHETRYSWRGPQEPVPYEDDPKQLFERMFRGRVPGVPNWARRPAAIDATPRSESPEQGVIDAVLEEAKGLKAKLGKDDVHRLEEYLAGVQSVERRVRFLDAVRREEALDAKQPGPSKLLLPATPDGKALRGWDRDPERHGDYIRLMGDLMILALQTDTTRVVSFAAGSDEALFPGVVTVGYERHAHTLEHQGNADKPENADPIAREACRQVHAWYTRLFGELVQKMKAIDEGGSTLLDNTMTLYTSYMSDGGHGRENYPILLAGKAQGTLKPGRHLVYKPRTPVSNLYVEMLDRLGVKAEGFGESTTSKHAAYDGRLPDLG